VEEPVALKMVTLKHDDGTMEGKRSMAGSGHAILFSKPAGEWYLKKVQIYGSCYGYPQAPEENFKVYVCDIDMNVIKEIETPYSRFQRGVWRWVFVDIPDIKVPSEFYVCVSFNPTQTKGVYVGFDENVTESHSKNALPSSHLEDVGGKFDWMIRAVLSGRSSDAEKLHLTTGKDEVEEMESQPPETEGVAAEFSEGEKLGGYKRSEHLVINYDIPEKYADAIIKLCETAIAGYKEWYSIDVLEIYPDRTIKVSARKGQKIALWVSPQTYPSINLTITSEKGLAPPTEGGPHYVYGFVHEFGHIAIGFDNGAWTQGIAYYIGSTLLKYVDEKLGASAWPRPYNYVNIEGPPRLMKGINAAKAGTEDAACKILYEVEKKHGAKAIGKAVEYTKKHARWKPFGGTKAYFVEDFKKALMETTQDESIVELFEENGF
jgi:hypothetical protein